MAAIRRIETKVDAKANYRDGATDAEQDTRSSEAHHPERPRPTFAPPEGTPPSYSYGDVERVKLSFSARRIVDSALQIADLRSLYQTLHLEAERAILPPSTTVSADDSASGWLSTLSLSHLKRLCDLYFETFNRTAPILDRESFSRTVGVAVETGFGNNLESCLVLTVMALGCMGQHAFDEGGFATSERAKTFDPLLGDLGAASLSPQDNTLALRFFDEGRRRIGFLLTGRDIRTCQYFLLAAAFYAVLLRPLEEWAMTSQACTISASFWLSNPDTSDEYNVDLQRRVFWSALMRETILADELELPRSPLQSLEGLVPLPKFVRCSDNRADRGGPDEYYHCHYLAQIAVRIIMTRVRDELFYANPSVYLAQELYHQLEQWRSSLPRLIRDDFDSDPITHEHPAQTLVVAVLQSRYWISIYHIGRPFLYKIFTNPSGLTKNDLDICRRSLNAAIAWFTAFRRCTRMRSYMHLNFFVCGQLFGQLLIVYRVKSATDVNLHSIAPDGLDEWCRGALDFMQEIARSNPTVARDVAFVSKLLESEPHFVEDSSGT